jgi:hypothetical protein
MDGRIDMMKIIVMIPDRFLKVQKYLIVADPGGHVV